MTQEQTNNYFDALVARLGEGVPVPYVEFPAGKPNDCHKNAEVYAAAYPGHQPVRGWLVTPSSGIHMFHAHSMVRQPSGSLIDVTPGETHRAGLLFLEHDGSTADYAFLMVNRAQWFHPIPTDLSSSDPVEPPLLSLT
jgi:hypothetical protein